MSYIHIQDSGHARALAEDLATVHRFALDCEAAGFHRYSDRLCLLQVTTPKATYIVDPLAFDASDLMRPALEDPHVDVVMHGSDYDLRLLDRDLDARLRGLFDTQIAAALLGASALGLAALIESRLGVHLSKKYQRADWAHRPLDDPMLEYAAEDTRHLLPLADLLAGDLKEAGRHDWAEEECRLLERSATSRDGAANEEPEDPVVRVKGARDLGPRHVTALREALDWRDAIAKERDRAPFRVVGDQPLVEAVLSAVRDMRDLAGIKGFPPALARTEGDALLERLRRVAKLDEGELRPYPQRPRGPGRPPPEIEELVDRLKAVRNRRAKELGLDRGTLLSNAMMLEIAMRRPTDEAALARADGMRRWQMEVLGADLLAAISGSAA